jgi:hypothetical protein
MTDSSQAPQNDLFGEKLYVPPARRRPGQVNSVGCVPKLTEKTLPLVSAPASARLNPHQSRFVSWLRRQYRKLLGFLAIVTTLWYTFPPPLRDGAHRFATEKVQAELNAAYDKLFGHGSRERKLQTPPEAPVVSTGNSDRAVSKSSKVLPEVLPDQSRTNPIETSSISVPDAQKPKTRYVVPRNLRPAQPESKGPLATTIELVDQVLTLGKSSGPLLRTNSDINK